MRQLEDSQVNEAQVTAFVSLNKSINMLNWSIGKTIVEKQREYNWGSNFIEKIADDLQNTFLGRGGFSRANIFRMKAFYLAFDKSRAAARQFEELPIFSIPYGQRICFSWKTISFRSRRR